MRKGQVTVEFVLILMVLLLALNVAAVVSYEKTEEIGKHKVNFESRRILDDTAGKINTAWLEGDGFESTLDLPQDLMGLDYSLEIRSNLLILYCENQTYSKYLLTQNVTGIPGPGQNSLKNLEGEVVIA
jgi:hypothetical protein